MVWISWAPHHLRRVRAEWGFMEGRCPHVPALPSPQAQPCSSPHAADILGGGAGSLSSVLEHSWHSPALLRLHPLRSSPADSLGRAGCLPPGLRAQRPPLVPCPAPLAAESCSVPTAPGTQPRLRFGLTPPTLPPALLWLQWSPDQGLGLEEEQVDQLPLGWVVGSPVLGREQSPLLLLQSETGLCHQGFHLSLCRWGTSSSLLRTPQPLRVTVPELENLHVQTSVLPLLIHSGIQLPGCFPRQTQA